jgi:DNA invertase Pin-like site-specific DNA recombinase
MGRHVEDAQMGSHQRFDIASLMAEMEDEDDPRNAFAKVQERVREYRSAGWPIPDDLRRIERDLMTQFMAESQGR